MPVKYRFGVSAWGAFFVEAMTALAHDGRLDRGRSYAGRGNVVSLDFDGGAVSAKVRGSYQPFYRVLIRFPALQKDQVAKLNAILDADALLPSQLANGDMPEHFLKQLNCSRWIFCPSVGRI